MGKTVPKLKFLGGKPCFVSPVYITRPFIPDKKIFDSYLKDIFNNRFLTNDGKYLRLLEKEIASLHRVKYCVAVANGTIGLQLAIKALGITGEVIIPSFTFIATPHAALWQGLKVVFCDIDPVTLTIDPGKIEQLITDKTTGIIGVHVYGNPCDVDAIEQICNKRNLKLIFDSAHAFLCSKNGKMVGNFGNAEILSFHATKLFSTFEGGAILTNDETLCKKLRLMRNFGFTGYDSVESIGINAKLNEVSAAFGLSSLNNIRKRIKRGKEIYYLYERLLKDIPGTVLHKFSKDTLVNYQYVPILVNEKDYGLSRDMLYKLLWMENIMVRRYFFPGCHEMEPYKSENPKQPNLDNTIRAASQILCLPNYYSLSDIDIRKIAETIRLIQANKKEIMKCLTTTI